MGHWFSNSFCGSNETNIQTMRAPLPSTVLNEYQPKSKVKAILFDGSWESVKAIQSWVGSCKRADGIGATDLIIHPEDTYSRMSVYENWYLVQKGNGPFEQIPRERFEAEFEFVQVKE